MKAISVKQPWAYLIVNGFKDLENRTWATKYRGEVLIHASLKPDRAAMEKYNHLLPLIEPLWHGGFVGRVDIVDCIDSTDERANSEWFIGPKAFVLENPRPIIFTPAKGRLGIYTLDCVEESDVKSHYIV